MRLEARAAAMPRDTLPHADNLPMLRNHIPDGSEMFGETGIPLQGAAPQSVCPTQKGAL